MSVLSPKIDDVRNTIEEHIQTLTDQLYTLNKQLHDEPEIAFQEFKAQKCISEFLESQGHSVECGPYKLPTSFESRYGSKGRCVNFNAEYDALPELGHACGHNLIAIASIAAYLALTHALRKYCIDGRAQLLGTPAEEDGGGKILLLNANAYKNVDISLMIHPMVESAFHPPGIIGSAGQSSIAVTDLIAEFRGTTAHASGNPWDGLNALDALVASYNNVSMLRQHIKPDERIHGCILQAPKITNAIPEYTKVKFSVRSRNFQSLQKLSQRVRNCLMAGGVATGCEIDISEDLAYADLWVNDPLCSLFQDHMGTLGIPLSKASKEENLGGSTDMGNVSQTMPGLHAFIGIPAPPGAFPHDRTFAEAAGTWEAHKRILEAAKGMALTAWSTLVDDGVFAEIESQFHKMATECRQ
ncbi:peptidase M20 domain-containing protein 2 [Colletotrichum tofieldiae]|uniref:Peptidase M20 domain-containing protein 2 n=1 Tax=Colletotrichum tofieldiae TaxID=708197 RepID=A0A166S0Q1_9PEZI|nr:peptidase M20 domain-containing protein 2 [Colletotrichum tofieldiae]GKT64036.1 peptidase M20 domain-containing protein 2 [Colletotrichum tofieldiae]GKT71992.1 peptidase M20 domain-containing protein 2 [Colletotrichum tofieldiae]GKT90228.1 peptidase M20 domain-containing protein 2 [Colletotrichum tofieldiae]